MKKAFFIAAVLIPLQTFAAVPVRKTVAEFLAMSDTDTTYCELRGVVTRIQNHERSRLYISDGTGTVYLYGMAAADGRGVMRLDVRAGDTLTVNGCRFLYGSVVEMKNALYVSHSNGPDHDSTAATDYIDTPPTFKGGGPEKFSAWVASRLVYPKEAKEVGASGTVTVQFVVGRNGKVQEVQVLKGVHPALNAEAVRMVSSSPKWKPGKVEGRPVRVTYTIPVVFVSTP